MVTQRRAIELAAVAVAVVIGVLFVDRPLALWSQARLYHTPLYKAGEMLLRPLEPLGIAAAVLLGIALAWRAFGRPPAWIGRLIAGCVAGALALALTLALKYGLGRSAAYPLFLQERIYAFHLLNGSENYASFPSATMSAGASFLGGLGLGQTRARAVTVVVLLALALALIATNSHWLSDIIAGTWLGITVGQAVSRRSTKYEPSADGVLP